MITLRANENAIIDVIDGAFPLGQRNTIKVFIADENLKQYIKTVGTDTCLKEHNLINYGDFNQEHSIDNIVLNLTFNSSVYLASGYLDNLSRCLYCTTTDSSGLGTCKLKLTGKLEKGKKYKLSFKSSADATGLYLSIDNNLISIANSPNKWQAMTFAFTANSDNIDGLYVIMSSGWCYLDDIQLFSVENEVADNYYDNIEAEIKINNPIQNTVINEIINYSLPTADEPYIILYMPEISVVDFQDNLMCNLVINLLQEPHNSYLGNTYYHKEKTCVYQSENFVLNGFILPPDSEQNEYELVVGKV